MVDDSWVKAEWRVVNGIRFESGRQRGQLVNTGVAALRRALSAAFAATTEGRDDYADSKYTNQRVRRMTLKKSHREV